MSAMRMALPILMMVPVTLASSVARAQKPADGVVVTRTSAPATTGRAAVRLASSTAARDADAAKPNDPDWVAPKQFAREPNPVPSTSEAIRRGRDLYLFECAECHGRTGHGDGPQAMSLQKRPPDLSSTKVQSQTDGALLWKIQNGRGLMPRSAFAEDDLWPVVVLMRTFATVKR